MRGISEENLKKLERFDELTDKLFDPIRGKPAVDRVYYTASAVGDHGLFWMGIALIESLARGDKLRTFWRLCAVLAVESVLVNGVIKSIFRRQRPEAEDRPLYLRQPLTSSFPSGHAASAFCCAVMLAKGSGWLAPIYYICAFVIATSRVHVKIHHGSDVAAGALLGVALGLVGRATFALH